MSRKLDIIAVIIPVYNVEDYLHRCICSVKNNTYRNLMIVCVDDGSTDNSGEILKDAALADNRIVVLEQKNMGVSAARNNGLTYAIQKGADYVFFLDSDDWVHPQCFEVMLKKQKESDADICICPMMRVSGDITEYDNAHNVSHRILSVEELYGNKTAKRSSCGRLYSLDLIRDVRYVRGVKNCEDTIFNLSAMRTKENMRICWMEKPLYFYFSRSTSASHSFLGSDLLPALRCFLELLQMPDTTNDARMLLATEILSSAVSCRYLSMFLDEARVVRKECNGILRNTWSNIRKYHTNIPDRMKYRFFSGCPLGYRMFRILMDPTMLGWEKNQKQARKKRVEHCVK